MSGENAEPQAVAGIGRTLESARQSRGLSLWQVEQETRIRSRYLRDLEREDFDVLPAVYVLGSLKTYADFLGLDGAVLSRQLRASLVEPAEPDVPAQVAAPAGGPDGDDEYEAAPASAIGFDQLFLGMGVILISILAIMTVAAAVAQGDRSPVSQIEQPSVPEAPSEIALAGDVREEDDGAGSGEGSSAANKKDRPEDAPETPKDGEEGEGEQDNQDTPREASLFGDVEFVPMSPSTSTTASASTSASASASPAPSSPAPSSSTPSSPAPATARPDDSSASAVPAPAGASPEPADDGPTAAPAPSGAPSGAPAAAPAGPEGGGGRSAPLATASNEGPIPAEVDRMIDEAFEANGLD